MSLLCCFTLPRGTCVEYLGIIADRGVLSKRLIWKLCGLLRLPTHVFEKPGREVHDKSCDHLDTKCDRKPGCSLIMEKSCADLVNERKCVGIPHNQSGYHLDKSQHDNKK